MSALAERLQARIDDLEDEVRVLREALAAECAPLGPLGLTPQQEVVMAALMRSERASSDAIRANCEARKRYGSSLDSQLPKVVVCNIRRKLDVYGVEIETIYGFGYRMSPASKARVREVCGVDERLAQAPGAGGRA